MNRFPRTSRRGLTAELAEQLNATPAGDGQWSARCPAHDDRTASLSLGTGDDGRVLLCCHAGCDVGQVCQALGIPVRALFPGAAGPQRGKGRDWVPVAQNHAENLDDAGRAALATELQLPVEALGAVYLLGRGADAGGCYWSFPEVGFAGDDLALVGVTRRYFDTGEKKAMSGGKRGLALPVGWLQHDGPVLIPEGWSDVLALAHAGLSCVGRPSATGGVDLLATLLGTASAGTAGSAGTAPTPSDPRDVIILAENDRKPDGSWPGRAGAFAVAQGLAERVGRRVGVAFPPDGAKDARAWFDAHVGAHAGREGWRQAGQRLLDNALRTAEWVDPPEGRPLRRPVVLDPTDVAGTADVLADILYRAEDVFALGGALVRVRRQPRFDESNTLAVSRRVEALDAVTAADAVSRVATFHRPKGDGHAPCRPPEPALAALLARDHVERVTHLRGVAHAPLLLPDGRLVARPGHDPVTGWYVDLGELRLPPVPERPTRDDAVTAAWGLLGLVDEFPWRGPCDWAAWLAYLLTLCCRSAYAGCTPLFAFSAPTPGSGKSLAARIGGLVALGREPGLMPLPVVRLRHDTQVDEAEMRKALYAAALAGSPLVVFDNVGQHVALGGAALDLALTAGVIRGRTLGYSEDRELPWPGVVAATGNNLLVAADTARRVVYARMEPEVERPAERGNFRIPDLAGYARRQRGELLVAAFTILRAYLHAGKPGQGLPHLGSFEAWSDTVRAAVAWVTEHDPLGAASDLPTVDAADGVAELLRALGEVAGIRDGLTSRQVLAAARAAAGTDQLAALRAILAEWARPGEPLPGERSLGMRLGAVQDRVAGGLRLRRRPDRRGTIVWNLEVVSSRPDDPRQSLQSLQSLQGPPPQAVLAGTAGTAGTTPNQSDAWAARHAVDLEEFDA